MKNLINSEVKLVAGGEITDAWKAYDKTKMVCAGYKDASGKSHYICDEVTSATSYEDAVAIERQSKYIIGNLSAICIARNHTVNVSLDAKIYDSLL